MVITGAVFGLGCGGLFDVLRPLEPGAKVRAAVARSVFLFSLSLWALPLMLNAIPFNFENVEEEPLTQLLWFLILYPVVIAPFFFVGLSICRLFSASPRDIRNLYFWDLAGAALGAVLLIPVLPPLGAERVLMFAAVGAMVAAVLLADAARDRLTWCGAALGMLVLPSLLGDVYMQLRLHDNRRNVRAAIENGSQLFSRWDPVSRIDVLDHYDGDLAPSERKGAMLHVAYDGGGQSTHLYSFDGDLAALRAGLPERVDYEFWTRAVLASHYLRRDTGHSALIIGSAGGQETKAALLFGAADVDAIEMVGTVVDLVTGRYASYIGGIFQNPAVHVQVGEGRSFLRSTAKTYDVIQIFSNHNSSSIAAGNGAIEPVYQQTTEAYLEYFSHLKPDGILQINRHVYPKLITTAALAWKKMGRSDFRDHVIVVERTRDDLPEGDMIPTLLVKMTPWTQAEVDDVASFFAAPSAGEARRYAMVENPLDPANSFLRDAFYSGSMPASLLASAPYDVSSGADDRPYFNFIRRRVAVLEADREHGLNWSTASLLNQQIREGLIPMDWLHLIAVAIASLVYGGLFLLAPLALSEVGRAPWTGKLPTLSYFSLIGLAFIVIELTFIQIFIHVIGYPLYAIAAVIASMLIAAALGSMTSEWIAGRNSERWYLAFGGAIASGALLWVVYPLAATQLLQVDVSMRIAATCAMILPTAFFLGMPFPLGILELRQKPKGAIAWAWRMNGLFTTVGGLVSVFLALLLGFRITLLVALALYGLAGLHFALLRRSNSRPTDVARDDALVDRAVA
jgi:hypothetical protein